MFLCYNLALTDLMREMVDRAKARKRLRRGEIVVRSWEELAANLVNDAGLSYDAPAAGPERTRFYEQELPQFLVQIVREKLCKPQFDALVVDEAQDHDTSIPGFPADWVGPGWWGVYWALLRDRDHARIAAFYDPAQRPAFRGGVFEARALLHTPHFRAVQVKLVRTVRYSRPLFHYLKGLKSDALAELNAGLIQRSSLPDGPEVTLVDACRDEVPQKVNEIVSHWFKEGWCRPEQVLLLSRHSQQGRSALADCQALGGKPLVEYLKRRSGEIGRLSVNRAKGLDALAVVLIDYDPWEKLSANDQVGFFMGASRARQLLAVIRTIDNM